MKVGILTFHCAHNYGAVIQAFCVQEFFKQMGHDVYVIDYRPDYLTKSYKVNFEMSNRWKLSPINFAKSIIYNLYNYNKAKSRYNRFEKFINTRLNLIEYDTSKLDTLDVFVFGGDQIWNPNITGGKIDKVFFGDFQSAKAKILISLAASAGSYQFSSDESKYLDKQLSLFHKVFVREENLVEQIRSKTSVTTELTLDPTFLIESDTLKTLAVTPGVKEKYVLLFRFFDNNTAYSKAKGLAEAKRLKLIEVLYGFRNKGLKKNDIISNCSPEKLLGYFFNAEYVVTTSFHGVAFSIIFQKRFFFIETNEDIDIRSKNLLQYLGFKNYYNESDNIVDEQITTDTESSILKIELERSIVAKKMGSLISNIDL